MMAAGTSNRRELLETSSNFFMASKINIIKTPEQLPDHIKKVAFCIDWDRLLIQKEITIGHRNNILHSLDQTKPLSSVIFHLCCKWNLPMNDTEEIAAQHYALKFEGRTGCFITEANRGQIKNGGFIFLASSPVQLSIVYHQKLNALVGKKSLTEKEICLVLDAENRGLVPICDDETFAKHFINDGGMNLLLELLRQDVCTDNAHTALMSAIYRLGNHQDLFSWHEVGDDTIELIISNLTGRAKHEKDQMIIATMSIIFDLLQNCNREKYEFISSLLPFESMIRHLQRSAYNVKTATLKVMNIIWNRADQEQSDQIAETVTMLPMRDALSIVITQAFNLVTQEPVLYQQLALMQRMWLNKMVELGTRMEKKEQTELLESIYLLLDCKDPSKLGFEDTTDPLNDFNGQFITLRCLVYMVEKRLDQVKSIVCCDNDDHRLPLAKMSIMLMNMLIKKFKMHEQASNLTEICFYPMLLSSEQRPLQELFIACLHCLHKQWLEMHAEICDTTNVMKVVDEHLDNHLFGNHLNLAQLRETLHQCTFDELQEKQKTRASAKEMAVFNCKAAKKLKHDFRTQLYDLVLRQRYKMLETGTCFEKYARTLENEKTHREKGKMWYWHLANNHRSLFYSDPTTSASESPSAYTSIAEQKLNRVAIDDIEMLLVGREHNTWKEVAKKTPCNFVFSLILKVNDNASPEEQVRPAQFNFNANDESTFCAWIDGLRLLIEPTSKERTCKFLGDIKQLADICTKIQLVSLDATILEQFISDDGSDMLTPIALPPLPHSLPSFV